MKLLDRTGDRARWSASKLSGVIAMGLLLTVVTKYGVAHSLWFDVPAVVKTGQPVPVKIYFGEYHENLREISGGRLDERSNTKLHVLGPAATTTANLRLKQKQNHFLATLSTKKSGVYDLMATDNQSPVVDYTKYGIGVIRPIFYARARLLAFKKDEVSERTAAVKPQLDFDIVPLTRALDIRAGTLGSTPKQEIPFQVFFKGKPFTGKAEISIYAPNGWLWQPRIDAQGIGRFTPLWPGVYVIDIVYLEREPGTFSGKAYEAIRHRATLTLPIRDFK
ncbi:MAG: DUF4198 domain-containing protein [Psychrobium sp.]|nr:DUF4198 domain-containing protein [Psychrobium sp.]